MSKLEPLNRMEAFAHQIKDDAERLLGAAVCGSEETYEKFLQTLEAQISAYRNKNLIKKAEKTKRINAEKVSHLRKKSPKLFK